MTDALQKCKIKICNNEWSYPQVLICCQACYNKYHMTTRRLLQALTLTLLVFSFAGWVYIVINSEVHPWTLHWQLTHFAQWPHEDTFGEICFAVSFISFFAYQLLRDERRK